MGEGNDEKWVYSSVNFLGELTQSNKRFPKQKNLFCKLFTMGGGMCGPIWYISDYGRRAVIG